MRGRQRRETGRETGAGGREGDTRRQDKGRETRDGDREGDRPGTGKALVARWEPSLTLPAHQEFEAQLPCIFTGVRFQIHCTLQG